MADLDVKVYAAVVKLTDSNTLQSVANKALIDKKAAHEAADTALVTAQANLIIANNNLSIAKDNAFAAAADKKTKTNLQTLQAEAQAAYDELVVSVQDLAIANETKNKESIDLAT